MQDRSNNTKIPEYFYFKTSYGEILKLLSDEQAGKLIKLLCNYVAGKDEFPTIFEDTVLEIAAVQIKQDVDKALNKYRVACENGSKGGAPKGNKNAKKKKDDESSNTKKVDIFTELEINKQNQIVSESLYTILFDAKKTNFNITEFFSKLQLAELTACWALMIYNDEEAIFNIDWEYWEAKGDTGGSFGYNSLKEFALNTSASTVCKKIKERTEHWYEKDDFISRFADYKQIAMKLLKYPYDEIAKFNNICYNVENYTECTDEEFQELQSYVATEKYEEMREKRDKES